MLAFGFGRTRVYGFGGEEPFLVISLHLLEIYPYTSKKKGSLVGKFKKSRYGTFVWNFPICWLGNYPNFLFVKGCVMKSPNFSINVILVGLISALRFVLVGNHPMKMAKIPFMYNPKALRLDEGSFAYARSFA